MRKNAACYAMLRMLSYDLSTVLYYPFKASFTIYYLQAYVRTVRIRHPSSYVRLSLMKHEYNGTFTICTVLLYRSQA